MLNAVTLSVVVLNAIMPTVAMLNAVMLSVIVLGAIMPSVAMLNAVTLSVVVLSVVQIGEKKSKNRKKKSFHGFLQISNKGSPCGGNGTKPFHFVTDNEPK